MGFTPKAERRDVLPEALDAMFQTARAALPEWRSLPVTDRLKPMARLRRLLVRDADIWTEALRNEARKTPMDALTSDLMAVLMAIRFLEKHARRTLRSRKVSTPFMMAGARSRILREPHGVVAVISPWNFPLQLALIPALTALAAGNAVMLKPSEKLPACNELLATLLREAGFPPGVCHVIEGGKETVEAIVDKRPDKIFFTGGTEAGGSIARRAAERLIPCDLELGGKDAMIVCKDADLDRAARAAAWGGFMNSGQVCVGIERVYADAAIFEAFGEKVAREAGALRYSAEGWSDTGAMTTEEGWLRCKELLDDAERKGARILCGGLPTGANPPLFAPTVLTNVTPDMRLMKEEIFGPLLPILPFGQEEDAVKLVNDSPYGLSASVFTGDRRRGEALAGLLEVGSVAVNDVILPIANMNLPFGGVKNSGIGRTHGEEGLLAWTRSKSVMIRGKKGLGGINWFPYTEKSYAMLRKAVILLYGRDAKPSRRKKA